MGCWHGTCMLSHLPILYGDKIKLVILHSPHGTPVVLNQGGYVYPSGVLSPAFLAISGKYNDYGGIEEVVKDWNYQLIETVLRQKFGNTIKVDRDVKTDWTLEDVIFGIERGEPKYDLVKNFDLSYVMIRQDVWDFAVEQVKNELVHHYDEKDGKYSGDIEYSKKLELDFEKVNQPVGSLIDMFNRPHIFNQLSEGGGKLMDSVSYHEHMLKATEEIKNDIFKQWSESLYISSFMNQLRKGWMVQSGAGSQSDNWEQNIAFSKKIIDICQERLKEQDYE